MDKSFDTAYYVSPVTTPCLPGLQTVCGVPSCPHRPRAYTKAGALGPESCSHLQPVPPFRWYSTCAKPYNFFPKEVSGIHFPACSVSSLSFLSLGWNMPILDLMELRSSSWRQCLCMWGRVTGGALGTGRSVLWCLGALVQHRVLNERWTRSNPAATMFLWRMLINLSCKRESGLADHYIVSALKAGR